MNATNLPGLPPGKTYEQALARATSCARHLWQSPSYARMTEDEKHELLETTCSLLCGGNKRSGATLAASALEQLHDTPNLARSA